MNAAPVAAHGVPWELWVVTADGAGLQRLTDLREDSPRAAWSPDGKWIALKGELGMYLLGADGKHLRRIVQELAGDGLAWLEP